MTQFGIQKAGPAARTLAALVFCVVAAMSQATDFTQSQLVTLKNDINANFLAQWNAQQIDTIVSAYNAAAVPAFIVWKPSLDAEMYRETIVWTELTGRTAGERDMFSFLTGGGTMALACNRATTRQAVNDAFSGAGGVNTRTALIAACKRPATRFERLYTTGTGSDATPGQVPVEGPLTAGDVIAAMGQ